MQESLLTSLEDNFPGETKHLARVFDHTTNSYKLYWFKAILSILPGEDQLDIPIPIVLREMVVIAWHTVAFFRLSLGRQDMLQRVIDAIRCCASIEPLSSQRTIRDLLLSSPEFTAEISRVGAYVPERFLTPWFSAELRGLRDARKNATIVTLAKERFRTESPPMYDFGEHDGLRVITVHPAWRTFIIENVAVLRAFVDFHLVAYLQRKNPSTPGIVDKLDLPMARDLTYARQYWGTARSQLAAEGNTDLFRDIYTGTVLDDVYSIDHFVPWSFVMHDLIWNLTPVEPITNSSKGDRVPNLDRYLTPFARLHHQTLHFAELNRSVSDMYVDCFRLDLKTLAAMAFADFRNRVQDTIMPLAKVAGNQGFESGWVPGTR